MRESVIGGGLKQALRLIQVRLYPALQRSEVECAALAGDLAAIFKDGQGWDAADIEAGGQLLLGFGVDLN